ncbi:ferric reductase transmembrane component 7 [Scheffersomyces xylosifermentans]|uniref:ferric reductase transmembrane component 7 n=1 Tax=Scheffersomyces xylosifermentans TaxID=1304137 RepID=UPI00315D1031
MFNWTKRTTFEGLDCIADQNTPEFMALHKASSAQVAWADQAEYGKYTVYFGVAVIFLAFVKHLWYRYRDYSYKKTQSSQYLVPFVDVLVSYSRYLGYKQIPQRLSYFTSLPASLGSTIFMFVSSMYLLCYCLVPHFWYRPCTGFGSPPLAIRSGIMATALTPFVYVLAGKSNMITFLTGISYEKLNQHHQYVGLAAFVLAIIHTVPFIYSNLREGGASSVSMLFRTDFAYYSGIPPLILLGWLCIASKAWIRKHVYEVFVNLHWAAGIAYFGTLIWHIDKTLNCDNYMWGALAFWASQILYRMLVKTCFKPNSLFLRPRIAKLQKLNDNAFQVTVANSKGYEWGPGQHCFLRFAGVRFLDNHPFSIASMIDEDSREMKFIIIPKKGLTRTLFNQLDEYVAQDKKVFVDGPYGGTPRDPTAFDRVILASTGTGVTATLPFLLHLAGEISKAKAAGSVILTKHINFIWIVRQQDDIKWIRDELIKCKDVAGEYITIDIYDLIKKSFEVDVENQVDSNTSSTSTDPFNVHMYKPSINRVLGDMRHTLGRRNMIVSSGSESMKAQVSTVASHFQALIFNNDLNNSCIEEIYLHTETFGW